MKLNEAKDKFEKQLLIEKLEENNYNISNKSEFGTTGIIRKAISSGEIDIYPEYTGNGGFFFSGTEPEIWKDFQKGYELVKKLDLEKNNIVWLKPAMANNTWAIAVRKDLADKEKLKTLKDFSAYVNRGGKIKIACSEEFVTRPDSLPAFEKAYGFHLKESQLLVLAGGNTANTEKAAARGTSGVNTAMAYGTDGQIAALGLLVLEDNLGVQPVYAPAPIVRKEIIERYPEIKTLLKPVFESLDLKTLQRLNSYIAVDGRGATAVAKEYLEQKRFIKK